MCGIAGLFPGEAQTEVLKNAEGLFYDQELNICYPVEVLPSRMGQSRSL